jgi:hypothetical protein
MIVSIAKCWHLETNTRKWPTKGGKQQDGKRMRHWIKKKKGGDEKKGKKKNWEKENN